MVVIVMVVVIPRPVADTTATAPLIRVMAERWALGL
jgi:hypothetical protein